MRAYVYIDGFNVYYRALRKTAHKWLNVQALATELLHEDDEIEAIREQRLAQKREWILNSPAYGTPLPLSQFPPEDRTVLEEATNKD